MKFNWRSFLGVFLLGTGTLFVLQNLNVFPGKIGSIIWATAFGMSSLYFLYLFFRNQQQWLWLIFGLATFSIATGNLVSLVPALEKYSNLVSVFGVGVGFLLIVILNRQNWWAIIPGGILISLGVSEILEISSPEVFTGGVLYWGLGITFLLVFMVLNQNGLMNWSVFPTIFFLALGTLATLDQRNNLISFLGPGLLIVGGIIFLVYSLRTTTKN